MKLARGGLAIWVPVMVAACGGSSADVTGADASADATAGSDGGSSSGGEAGKGPDGTVDGHAGDAASSSGGGNDASGGEGGGPEAGGSEAGAEAGIEAGTDAGPVDAGPASCLDGGTCAIHEACCKAPGSLDYGKCYPVNCLVCCQGGP
jgi:hypothetical protein